MAQTSVGPVFMSYSRRDKAVMQRIATFLRKEGINVWVDNEKLVPGTPIWEIEVENAIISAGAVVVLLSPDSKNSPWVRREIGYAEGNGKRIFPILISGDERNAVPIRLINHQRIDVRQNEEFSLNSLSAALFSFFEELGIQELSGIKAVMRKPAEKVKGDKLYFEKLGKVISIDSALLKKIISQVSFSASKDETRPVLTGVFIEAVHNNLKLVAADGYRLSLWKSKLNFPVAKSISAIIPAQDLNKLADYITEDSGLIGIEIDREQGIAIFKFSGSQMSSKLIDGNYPDINKIIPSSSKTRAIFDTNSLLHACRQAELSISNGLGYVKLEIKAQSNNISPIHVKFASKTKQSDYTATVDAEIEGVNQEIIFNHLFLREALEAIDSPKIIIEAIKPDAPVVIRSFEGDEFLHVLMPMKLT